MQTRLLHKLMIATLTLSCAALSCTKKQVLHGTVHLPKELESRISKTAVLYVVARPAGHEGGPPVAVKRFESPLRFPIQFELKQTDAMIPETDLQGQVIVSARIAQAGSALPIQSGDIEGVAAEGGPIEVGSSEAIQIQLDRIIE